MSRKQPTTTNENGGRIYAEKKTPSRPAKRTTILGRKTP